MLRALENGMKVRMVYWNKDIVGVDVPDDIKCAEKMLQKDPFFLGYTKK
jgi:CMP-2-keto-3-deoxyoctulosonic acid synthetase